MLSTHRRLQGENVFAKYTNTYTAALHAGHEGRRAKQQTTLHPIARHKQTKDPDFEIHARISSAFSLYLKANLQINYKLITRIQCTIYTIIISTKSGVVFDTKPSIKPMRCDPYHAHPAPNAPPNSSSLEKNEKIKRESKRDKK
jgi:hypothetical protein